MSATFTAATYTLLVKYMQLVRDLEGSDCVQHARMSQVFDERELDMLDVCASDVHQLLPARDPQAPLSANPLTAQLLDLITLMPDHQTQEILDYITSLRATRARRHDNQIPAPTGPDGNRA